MNYPLEGGRIAAPEDEQIIQEEKQIKGVEKEGQRKGEQEEASPFEGIDDLLEMGELVLKEHNLSDKEIERLMEVEGKFKEEQEYLESLVSELNIDDRYIAAIGARLRSDEPPADYIEDYYNEMVSQEITTEVERAKIERLYSLIGRFEEKKHLTDKERVALIQLQEKKEEIDAELSAALVEKREEIQRKYIGYYKAMADSLQGLVKEIEGYPQVKAALEQRSEEEKRRIEAERAAAEKAKADSEALQWTELHQLKDNLKQRNENAIQAIEGLTGKKGFIDELRPALQLEDTSERQSAFDSAWSVLEKAILEGEKSIVASDIYPWVKPGPNYRNSLYFLEEKGNREYLGKIASDKEDKRAEKAEGALRVISRIKEDNLVLFALLGNFLEKQGKFSRAIAKRKEYEQKGIIKILAEKRKELEGKRGKYEKEAGEIVASGGFGFEIPIAEDIKGERIQIGSARGALKLVRFEEEHKLEGEDRRERRQIRKGKGVVKKEGWRVEMVGGYDCGIKVGDEYQTDFSDAFSFVKRAAKIWVKKSGLSPEGEK